MHPIPNCHSAAEQHLHAVHFYSDHRSMEAHMGTFIHDGLHAGQIVVAIATKERREGFAQHLRAAVQILPVRSSCCLPITR